MWSLKIGSAVKFAVCFASGHTQYLNSSPFRNKFVKNMTFCKINFLMNRNHITAILIGAHIAASRWY